MNAPLAIITGASSGIGAAMARQLHRRGWSLGLIARRAELLEELAEELGAGVAWRVADVTDAVALAQACCELEDELGPCELMLANAGIAIPTDPTRLDPTATVATMRVNYEGVVNAVAAVLPGMLSRGRGQLAATSSFAGWVGLPGMAAYSSSKAAVTCFMESIRGTLRAHGVAVTTIHPGYVRTEITAKNRGWMPLLMDAEPFAARAVRGLTRRQAEVNVPWPMSMLLGLLRRLPCWLFDLAMVPMTPRAHRERSRT
jgi:short-subunit dehydrogenase